MQDGFQPIYHCQYPLQTTKRGKYQAQGRKDIGILLESVYS